MSSLQDRVDQTLDEADRTSVGAFEQVLEHPFSVHLPVADPTSGVQMLESIDETLDTRELTETERQHLAVCMARYREEVFRAGLFSAVRARDSWFETPDGAEQGHQDLLDALQERIDRWFGGEKAMNELARAVEAPSETRRHEEHRLEEALRARDADVPVFLVDEDVGRARAAVERHGAARARPVVELDFAQLRSWGRMSPTDSRETLAEQAREAVGEAVADGRDDPVVVITDRGEGLSSLEDGEAALGRLGPLEAVAQKDGIGETIVLVEDGAISPEERDLLDHEALVVDLAEGRRLQRREGGEGRESASVTR